MTERRRILTGIRPTGALHLGHYAGALQNWVRLQDEYECYFLIADYQVSDYADDIERVRQSVVEVALDWLAVGLDPEGSHYVIESLVPENAELTALLSWFVPLARLQRNPTLKAELSDLDESKKSGAPVGFFIYPVMQVANILLPRAHLVPVGDDQLPHIEMTREVARMFNRRFGEVFPEPEGLLTKFPRLVGTDGQSKMSKSRGNSIELSDPADVVTRKVMGMYTDPTRLRATDPGHVEGNPVFMYHDAFNPDTAEVEDLKERYGAGRVGDVEVKKKLAAALNTFLEPIRDRRAHFEARPSLVREALEKGAIEGRRSARETMAMVHSGLGLNYLNDVERRIREGRIMYYPTLDDAKAAAHRGTVIPIYREVLADLETPVSAYLKVARGPYSFLLESVEGGERLARYSFMGTEPYRVFRAGPSLNGGGDPLLTVEEELKRFTAVPVEGLPRFVGGAVGFLGYEAVRHYEPRVPVHGVDALGLPEAQFMFADTLLVFDHLKHVIKVVSYVRLDGDIEASYRQAMWKIEELVDRLSRPLTSVPENGPAVTGSASRVESNIPREDYLMAVERAREFIVAGDAIQVVLAQRLRRRTTAHPFNIYRGLRHVNPSPYMFYLDFGEYQIAGASPELLVRVEDGLIDYHPIAGTRPRGRTEEQDHALEEELRASEKERAEHIMLVDLGRNDVGRVSAPGTVRVTDLMSVERYSHVMHLVSHITGQLRDNCTPFDALRSCFPAGTVSGAPKVRAMEIIGGLEPDQRGAYAGCVGYFGFDGNIDTCITIRTLVIKDGMAYIQAGGGVVFDSDPAEEYQETINKAQASLRAIDDAERSGAGRRSGSLGY